MSDHDLTAEVEARLRARVGLEGTSVGSVVSANSTWPAPQPLPIALPPVMAFDPDLLPESVRGWIVDIADRVQCPIDFPAISVMVGLASVIGRRVGIRPKRQDEWTVVCNLWGAGIGRPGVMKTPAIQEPLRPLKRLEIEAKADHEQALKDAEASNLVGEARKKVASQKIKKNLTNPDEAIRLARETLDEDEVAPKRRRFIVNDTTVEKLGETLNENPNGFLLYRDEIVGWLKSLDKDGQESARAFYLESWNGTGRFTYDRISRGTLDIEAAITSIIGAIQPGPLSQYLRAAVREGATDDGLIQRFQMLVWPDISKEWKNVDRWPDSDAKKRASHVFTGLSFLEPTLVYADTDANDADCIPYLRFDDTAQAAFDLWREALEPRVRSGDLHPALESHLAKYRSLIPSLALIDHLAEGRTGPVTMSSLDKAIRWGVYLESHARRVYSQAIHPDVSAAQALAKRLLSGEVTTAFALRDVYRKGWSGLSTLKEAQGAVELLCELDWLYEDREPTEGRTATVYFVNPRIHELASQKNRRSSPASTDRTAGSPLAPPSGSSVSPTPEGSSENSPPDEGGAP